MPDIVPSYQPNIKEELKELSRYKFHPSGIQNHTLNRLTDMLDGKVELMDPSNPFLYLLESSCLNTTFAIQEYLLTARKLYPRLANSSEDLYLHMSDFDYLGRFGEPVDANVVFNIDYRAFKRTARRTGITPNTGDYVLRIPKHFQITIDSFVFTLLAPITIVETANGILDLKLDIDRGDIVYPYNTNLIKHERIYINNDEQYITFRMRLPELLLETTEVPVEKNSLFKKKLSYKQDRQFYYFKAYRLDSTNNWKEMLVTHTDQVYDIDEPTCLVKVLPDENKVEYYIPPVYINSGMVKGKVKFVIYSTKGSVSVNFTDYDTSEFKGSYNKVFPETDLDTDSNPLNMVPKVFYIEELVVGGRDSVPFEQLKRDVIDNSIGDRQLPVTDKQLSYLVRSKNFNLLRDIDTITDRIYLLETVLPGNLTSDDISRFNLDIIEYKTTIENLINTNRNFINKGNRNIIVIEKGSVFQLEDGRISPISVDELVGIEGLSAIDKIVKINNGGYISTYYHYVIDYTTDIIDLRAYDLERPRVKSISFDGINSTTDAAVNIIGMPEIIKITDHSDPSRKGYRLAGMASFTSFNENILSTSITPVLLVTDDVGNRFFLRSETPDLGSDLPDSDLDTMDDIIYFEFNLRSLFSIDRANKIHISNFINHSGLGTGVDIELAKDIKLMFLTNALSEGYEEGPMDALIAGSTISTSANTAVVSMENLHVEFGDRLDRLYSRIHTSVGDAEYEVYETDVHATYGYSIWGPNYAEEIHFPNDNILNELGEPIVKHRAGDFVLNENGDKVEIKLGAHNIYPNLMFIDYKVEVATNETTKEYYSFIRDYLGTKILGDAAAINEELLENTESFVVVPKSITDVAVNTHNTTRIIKTMQSFRVNIYVEQSIYVDEDTKSKIYSIVLNELDAYLSENTELKRTVILNRLYEELKNTILSIEFERFTEIDEEYISLVNKNARLGINKLLKIDSTGFSLDNDLIVSFLLITE